MAISKLDRITALIVVDVQDQFLSLLPTRNAKGVADNVTALLDAFRGSNLPVFIISTVGFPPGKTQQPGIVSFPNLSATSSIEVGPRDRPLFKRCWGAFANTSLELRLRELGVTQVVIAGLLTSIGVESTAREAYDLSFNVALSTDAIADAGYNAHANSIVHVFPRIGETGSTAEVVNLVRAGRR